MHTEMKNSRTVSWSTSTFISQGGEEEPAEKTEGAANKVELKKSCEFPGAGGVKGGNDYLCQMLLRGHVRKGLKS